MHHLNLEKSIQDLSLFLREDNDLLKGFHEKEVLKRSPRKEHLMKEYSKTYEAFKKDEAACKALSKDIKKTLIQKVQDLENLSQENFQLVGKVLGAHKFYLATMTRLTCEKVSPKVEGYSALGRYKGRTSPLPALSFNQCT